MDAVEQETLLRPTVIDFREAISLIKLLAAFFQWQHS